MATGTIKRLFPDRGFGFIKVEGGPDVFFHSSLVRDGSFDALEEGTPVEFELGPSEKGPRAAWVKPLASGAPDGR